MITIGSNIAALRAQGQLNKLNDTLRTVYERLSSGQRINKPSDDAAGLAIASDLNADTRILNQGIRNLNDGNSMIATAQGALEELSKIVLRQMELSEQAANGTYNLRQRKALQSESDELTEEFNRIIATTTFSGKTLLKSNQESVVLQAGQGTEATLGIALSEELSQNISLGSFATMTSEAAGVTTQWLEVGDINNDGNSDLIYSSGGTTIRAQYGNGDGTFGAETALTSIGDTSLYDVDDMNGDGNLDLVTRNTGDNAVYIYYGNGNGTFAARRDIGDVAAGSFQGSVADLNNDGYLDVFSAAFSGTTSIIHLSTGPTTYESVTFTHASSGLRRPEFGDFNGDGITDFVALAGDATSYNVMLGDGSGHFTLTASGTATGFGSNMAVGDFNLDGYDDVASGRMLLLGNGNGTFRTPLTIDSTVYSAYETQTADVNKDGNLDLVVGQYSGTTLRTYLGNGDGTFSATDTSTTGSDLREGRFADFNNDGVLDMAVGYYSGGGSLGIFISNTTQSSFTGRLNLLTQEDARASLTLAQETLSRISSEIGALGAYQARIDVAVNALRSRKDSYIGAMSSIADADVAADAAQAVRLTILQNTAASILSQANTAPQLAVTLLRNR